MPPAAQQVDSPHKKKKNADIIMIEGSRLRLQIWALIFLVEVGGWAWGAGVGKR